MCLLILHAEVTIKLYFLSCLKKSLAALNANKLLKCFYFTHPIPIGIRVCNVCAPWISSISTVLVYVNNSLCDITNVGNSDWPVHMEFSHLL